MSAIALFFTRPIGTQINRTVGGVNAPTILDATLKEKVSAKAEVTKHPVEKGADVSDHVIIHPKELSISGIMTLTPMGNFLAEYTKSAVASVGSKLGSSLGAMGAGVGALVGGAAGSSLSGAIFGGSDRKLENIAKEFEQIRIAKRKVDIQTGLQLYKGYILTSFELSRDQKSGGSVNVDLEFTEIIIARNQLSAVKIPKLKNALEGTDHGRQSTGEPTADASSHGQSLLKKIAGGFG